MIEYFVYLLILSLSTYGIVSILIIKSESYIVNLTLSPFKYLFNKINSNLNEVFTCYLCLAFWISLILDLCMSFKYNFVFFPINQFFVVGLTWLFATSTVLKDNFLQNKQEESL